MQEVEISVIVPVYNVEKYLNRCLKSLVEQSYRNFEIILVDDGSNDSSGEMCDNWKTQDPRIKVIHKANAGPSSARNTGINYANGQYICFIDSDDWIEKEYLSTLRDTIVQTRADFVQCNYRRVSDDKTIFDKSSNDKKILCLSTKEAIISALLNEKINWSPWGKLYKRECFNGIEFPEGKLFEDKPVTTSIILKSKKIVYIDCSLYNYFYNRNSITNDCFRPEKLDAIEMGRKSSQEIIEVYPDLERLCRSHLFFLYAYIFMETFGQPEFDSVNEEAYLRMNSYWKDVVFNKKTSLVGKFKAVIVLADKDICYRVLRGIQKWRSSIK